MTTKHSGEKSVSCLEADVAFFDARLMLVQDPETCHQRAQIKTYDSLRRIFKDKLAERRGRSSVAERSPTRSAPESFSKSRSR